MNLINWFFPRRCLGCGKSGQYFCPACLQLIKLTKNPICPNCFRSSIFGSTHSRCLKPRSLNGLVAVFSYEGMVKAAIKKLKYQFITDLAGELVSLTSQIISQNQGQLWPKFDNNWTLIPIPLHPRRERWRGFNQAEILGRLMSQQMNWRFSTKILQRDRLTKPQAELSQRKERQFNIQGVFKVNPDHQLIIKKSKFLIFDDVWTTGSTIKEAAKVLKRYQAGQVWALTVAR